MLMVMHFCAQCETGSATSALEIARADGAVQCLRCKTWKSADPSTLREIQKYLTEARRQGLTHVATYDTIPVTEPQTPEAVRDGPGAQEAADVQAHDYPN